MTSSDWDKPPSVNVDLKAWSGFLETCTMHQVRTYEARFKDLAKTASKIWYQKRVISIIRKRE